MNCHDDLAADLPPPNPDEPASLRRDIVDELADHLACAARQEALRAELDTDGETPDDQTITDRVLARFGDPRWIARRLWFDAMQGRLMMQKLTAAFAAIAAVGAIAGCVLLWTALDATRSTLAEAIAENRKLRDAAEAADEAKRKDLQAEVVAQKRRFGETEMQWRALEAKSFADFKKLFNESQRTPLKFKLVRETLDGKPAAGYTVSLEERVSRRRENVKKTDASRVNVKKTNANGVVDFGKVVPGYYTVCVTTPGNVNRRFPVFVRTGTETERTIICQ